MRITLLLLFIILNCTVFASNHTKYNAELAGFKVNINEITNKYNVMGIYVMPNEAVIMKSSTAIQISTKIGTLNKNNDNSWSWLAPKKSGAYEINIKAYNKNETMILNVFVLRPASDLINFTLDGYRIGEYPKSFKGLKSYSRPKGYIEVTQSNKNIKVSPHFTLGQFICKQYSKMPNKFIVLREPLLLKLETILEKVNTIGIKTNSFVIMSGYRTPFYNKSIGSKKYSRHMYGDAADFYIDVKPKDGLMDDINGDGAVNRKDADILYNLIVELSKEENWSVGGLGQYRKTHAHGPFVHVDVRGSRARWGH